MTDGVATLGVAPALAYRVDIRGVSAGHPAVSLQSVLPSELFFGGTVAIGASKIEVTDADTTAASLVVSAAAGATGSVTPASLSYQQLLGGAAFTYTHGGNLREQLLITVSDGTFTSTPMPLAVNARVSFANNLTPIVNGACADRCHAAGPLSFRTGGNVSYASMVSGTRVTFPENACTNAQAAPSGPLLRKPTASDALAPPTGHVGGVRAGFDLTGDRGSYDLFRYWICNFEAANN